MMKHIRSIWHDESGTEMSEVALVLAVVVLVGLVGYTILGQSMPPNANRIAQMIRKAGTKSP